MEGDEGRQRQAAAEQSAPLLDTTGGGNNVVYMEGCPGCAVDRKKAENPSIPYGSFLYVWIVTLCTGDQMVFFLLNVVELLGLILTFKPFLAVPEQYDTN